MTTSMWLLATAVDFIDLVSNQPASPAPTPAPAPSESLSVEQALFRTLIAAGPVGVFFIAVLFKFKIMTVSEHNTAVSSWDRERATLEKDNEELKAALREANAVYTQQVIPTLTRVLDAERELVDLRRDEQAERRRRGAGE